MANRDLPNGLVAFGPNANCTIDICPIEASVLSYRPNLAANIVFIALFALIGMVHTYLGWRWRSWGFMGGMLLGCLSEIIGYVGRVILRDDPFSFAGFMIQIVCLTIAPVFYTASIYVTLSKTIVYFAPDLSRFKPQLFYYIFIPFDVICLILQAAGGAMSTNADGNNDVGVNVSMAGLALQVIVLVAFVACFADFMIRYLRSGRKSEFDARFLLFFGGLSSSIVFILARCAYRVAELQDGYDGKLIKEEAPFIVLEGVLIVLAGAALFFGHPGLIFKDGKHEQTRKTSADLAETGSSGTSSPAVRPQY